MLTEAQKAPPSTEAPPADDAPQADAEAPKRRRLRTVPQPDQPAAPAGPPTHITEAENAMLNTAKDLMVRAAQQAQQAAQQAEQARNGAIAAEGAYLFVNQTIWNRYGLTNQDEMDRDGRIIRKTPFDATNNPGQPPPAEAPPVDNTGSSAVAAAK